MNISNTSRIGDVAEFLFDAGAVQRGFVVNRPIHAGTIYDRVVESDGRFYKVQIKCTTKEKKTGVVFKRNNNQPYPIDCVDVFAVYVLHMDTWYFFKNELQRSVYISLNRFNKNKENWDIFYEEI